MLYSVLRIDFFRKVFEKRVRDFDKNKLISVLDLKRFTNYASDLQFCCYSNTLNDKCYQAYFANLQHYRNTKETMIHLAF